MHLNYQLCVVGKSRLNRLTCSEKETGEVAGTGVESGSRHDETNDGHDHTTGDMPCLFVVLARAPSQEDSEPSSEQIRRAGKYQRDGR